MAIGHTKQIAPGISNGQYVTAGTVIAYVGHKGNSMGCHIHFEVDQAGSTNPPSVNSYTSVSAYNHFNGFNSINQYMFGDPYIGRQIYLASISGQPATNQSYASGTRGYYTWSDTVNAAYNYDFDYLQEPSGTIFLDTDPNGYTWYDRLTFQSGTQYLHEMWLCHNSSPYSCTTHRTSNPTFGYLPADFTWQGHLAWVHG